MCSVGSAVAHAETYPLHREKYGPTLAGLLDLGSRLTACDYERMSDARLHYTDRLRMLFEDIDILIVPVTGIAAPTLEKMSALRAAMN